MMRRKHDATGRTRGEPRHVRLYHWMLDTPAWQSLTGTQRAIYVEMVARYAGPGSNNGKLPYSVREAAQSLRIGKSTAQRDLKALQERGFIIPVMRGAFSRKVAHATQWRLTEFACDVTHAHASKEFARWSPQIQNAVPPQNGSVSEAGPFGTRRGTEDAQNPVHGTCSGTAKALLGPASVPVAGHL